MKSSRRRAEAGRPKFACSARTEPNSRNSARWPMTANFNGGVEVAVGDVNGDGKNDIVTVPTSGVTQVRVFYNNYNSGNPAGRSDRECTEQAVRRVRKEVPGWCGRDSGRRWHVLNGVTVNATTPDGKSEIVVGNGPGMRSTIYVYDVTGTPTVVDTILPFDNKFKGGITLDAARINADLIPDFIVSAGNGGKSHDRDLGRSHERCRRCSVVGVHRVR